MSQVALHPKSIRLTKELFRGGDARWPEDGEYAFADTFLADVVAQGIGPLIWYRLTKEGTPHWPEQVLSGLRDIATQAVATELVRTSEVRAVLRGLGNRGVDPLLIKGTPLAHTLYPESALRTRCDTDLLIPQSHCRAAFELLESLGYHGTYDAAAGDINAQVCFVRQGRRAPGTAFDIHWRLSNASKSFSDQMAHGDLRQRGVAVPALGEHARALGTVDALLFACFHRAGHYAYEGDRLIWLYDIHLLTQALSVEQAEDFVRRARSLGIGAICADALATTRGWFATSLLGAVEEFTKDPPRGEDTLRLLEDGRMRGLNARVRMDMKAASGLRARLKILWGQGFPPPRYMAWRYEEPRVSRLPRLYLKRFIEGVRVLF